MEKNGNVAGARHLEELSVYHKRYHTMDKQSCGRQYGPFVQDTVIKESIHLEHTDFFTVVFCGQKVKKKQLKK